MRVDLLRVADLRCHGAAELRPVAGVTAIVGPNGSGKTSLLEAVHLGTTGSGLRPTADSRMIRDGADVSALRDTLVFGPALAGGADDVMTFEEGVRIEDLQARILAAQHAHTLHVFLST